MHGFLVPGGREGLGGNDGASNGEEGGGGLGVGEGGMGNSGEND